MLSFFVFYAILTSFSTCFNNSCLLPKLKIPTGPQTFDACNFLIKTTDELWNLKLHPIETLHKYFTDDYIIIGESGKIYEGLEGLLNYTFSTMIAFPDIKIKILDCFCVGNDIFGYKCTMPDILYGTNTGPSIYGPPTNKHVKYMGLINSFIQNINGNWKYTMEWGVHDIITLLKQLNINLNNYSLDYISILDEFDECQTWIQYLNNYLNNFNTYELESESEENYYKNEIDKWILRILLIIVVGLTAIVIKVFGVDFCTKLIDYQQI